MTQPLPADSIWIDGSGRPLPVDSGARPDSFEDRVHAMDRLGWVNLWATPDRVEVWVNPLSVQQPALSTAVTLVSALRETAAVQTVVVKVHDREARGSLVAEPVSDLPDLVRRSIELTSRPSFPLMQDRLTGCLPTEINDTHVQDMWRFLAATQFRASEELMERVEASDRRAKIVVAHAGSGAVQYLVHDRQTAPLWRQPTGFAGRFLDELPLPLPVKRSLRSDLVDMLAERQIVVSLVRGLRRVMSDAAPMDSYFRVTIPLRWPGEAPNRPALVLLAPYG